MKSRSRILAVTLGVMALVSTFSAQAQSLIYGLTTNNSLVAFSTSGAVVSGPSIAGLGAGETAIAIDFRPFTGDLYLLTRDGANVGRLYTVNTVSGAATSVALAGAALNLTGSVGMDFNPAANAGVNALRIMTGSEQNYRITFTNSPATVIVDGSINPTNTPAGTNVMAVAYVNNRTGLPGGGGASGTTLYAIDSDTDSLYVVNPPNNGTLVAALPLGINISAVGGFDIATLNDRALGLFNVGGVNGLYEVNLTNGATLLLRSLPIELVNLAITLPVPFPPTLIYAITATNTLVSFSTDSTNVSPAISLVFSGGFGGERVLAIDFRPSDGALYALALDIDNRAELFKVNPHTGAATSVPVSPTTVLGFSSFVGMDFNPIADALRVVTDREENYRITFSGGSGTVITDSELNATGAVSTNVVAAAYSNNRAGLPDGGGAGGTTLYVLDSNLDVLYVQNPPNSGTLTSPKLLGIDIGPASGLDIVTGSDRALALLDVAGDKGLYEINLNTGLANLIRDVPDTLLDLAVPVPAALTSVSNIATGTNIVLNFSGGVGPFNVQRANIVNDPWCSVTTVTSGPVTLLKDGPQAFLRVRDLANAQPTRFTASLSGAAETPPNASNGTGFGTVELNGNSLTFDVAFTGLGSSNTIAHIHLPAPTGVPAGVSIDLAPFKVGTVNTTGRYSGTVTINLAQKTAILAGLSYFNVHTVNLGGGEIRGQIVPAASKFVLTGVGERPTPTTSPAFGAGALTIIGNRLAFDLTFQGLVANATLAHFHGPANSGGVASPIIDIGTGAFGALGGKAGQLTGVITLTPAQLAAFADGNVYVNIHSGTFPGGEIRGQVAPYIGELPFSADLTGAAEKPTAVSSPGSGFVESSLAGDTLSFVLTYRGMTSAITAAHIHGPSVSANTAGILFDLAPYHRGSYSTQGVFSGSVTLTPAQIAALINGDLYMNLHTAVNPSGEIRGQLAPMVFKVSMSGANEVPPIVTPATGFGYVGLVGKQVSIGLHYRDLAGNISASHYHGPADTTMGGAPVLVGIAFTGGNTWGFLFDAVTLSDANRAHFSDYLIYVNIHTAVNGGGEIRGQIAP
jgi:hypothetical protein